jgi:hypothetical protein
VKTFHQPVIFGTVGHVGQPISHLTQFPQVFHGSLLKKVELYVF